MVTYADLKRWDASRLGSASETLKADLATLERARDDLAEKTVPDSWSGLSRVFAQTRQAALVGQMDDHLEAVTAFERVVFATQPLAKKVTDDVAEIETSARQQEFSIGADGTVTDTAGPREFDTPRAADAYTEERTRLRDALVGRVEDVLDDAYEVDSRLVQARPDCVFNDDEPGGVVDPEVERAWAEMSDEERQAVLQKIAEDYAAEHGVEDFEVRFEDLEDQDGDGDDDNPDTNSLGSWSEDDRVLRLDVNDLDDPRLIDTAVHEARHATQHEAVRDLNDGGWWIFPGENEDFEPPPGATEDDVRDWEENFDGDNYVRPEDDFEGYENQPVERDARETGEQYLDDYDLDDLEEDREG